MKLLLELLRQAEYKLNITEIQTIGRGGDE